MSGRLRAADLRGAMTAIVTPMTEQGALDRPALASLVSWQIEQGIDGLVPCGTTGEGATLTDDEQRQVVATVVEAAGGRVPVIAGCGTNDTRRTVAAAQRAVEAGADGLLVVTPYYNKPNRSGMRAHYEAVSRATGHPIVIYNVPGRTGQDLGAAGILELAEVAGVVGVKEASANLEQIATILDQRGEEFAVLSGDDSLVLPAVALGADGVVSVVSNEAPAAMARLVERVLAGDLGAAREIHYRLLPLMRANFVESNPVPVKTAMAILGRCGATLRPPLGPAESSTRERLVRALELAGLHENVR